MFVGKPARKPALITLPLLAAALALLPCSPASAGDVAHPRVVSADPVATTPHVLDGIVNAFALIGGTVVVGGSFSEVRDAGASTRLPRSNLFAFDLATGKVDRRFAPRLDGPVYALAAGPDGSVYVGGAFVSAGGAPGRGLARLRLPDGSPVAGFSAPVNGGDVSSLVLHGGRLYVGGDFTGIGRTMRTALARVDAGTGAVDPAFTVTPGAGRGGELKIYAMAATRDRLAVDGSFTTLDGHRRPQVGLIDIAAARPSVTDWHTEAYAAACKEVFPTYVRGLDFSPDGHYFVIVTTGGAKGARKLCDSAARFETYSRGDAVRPTWVNHTGGDSLYSVAVTGSAVYVGGHQRWLNNPRGSDSAGPGAVARPGIGAIHPTTGKALAWNPTRDRGIGVKAFLAHKGGLLVGSDTTHLGHEYHARVGMFPLP
ncbi:delta-60 repeat domain-containing protein [Sphaerisporangium perillae]|uniref:delta-60 repeat domain-containing protein n=1 Tax=Sphaerisporangium perillae TaxID=2935860 RepID=UPI00200F38EA|nr:delta-60 repeat domain-containing protein [Sphaerisporangium perillae]